LGQLTVAIIAEIFSITCTIVIELLLFPLFWCLLRRSSDLLGGEEGGTSALYFMFAQLTASTVRGKIVLSTPFHRLPRKASHLLLLPSHLVLPSRCSGGALCLVLHGYEANSGRKPMQSFSYLHLLIIQRPNLIIRIVHNTLQLSKFVCHTRGQTSWREFVDCVT
jgi:hypothetical protein